MFNSEIPFPLGRSWKLYQGLQQVRASIVADHGLVPVLIVRFSPNVFHKKPCRISRFLAMREHRIIILSERIAARGCQGGWAGVHVRPTWDFREVYYHGRHIGARSNRIYAIGC